MNSQEDRWTAVGEAIIAERERRGMSQADLSRAAKLSDLTVRRLERGESGEYRAPGLRRIEMAFEWPPGTIAAIVAGNDLPAVSPPALPTDPVDRLRGEVEQLAQQVQDQATDIRWLMGVVEELRGGRASGQSQP